MKKKKKDEKTKTRANDSKILFRTVFTVSELTPTILSYMT